MRVTSSIGWLCLLVVIAECLGACRIANYNPVPIEPIPIFNKRGIIRFFYHTGAVIDPHAERSALPLEFRILQETLEERGGFSSAIVSVTPHAKGLHLMAYQSKKAPSVASRVFCTFTILTLFALPCYSDTGGSIVQYDVYVDDSLKKSYRYEIGETELLWIGLIPFAWVNDFMTSYKDAFKATTYQLLRDGHADRYLTPP